MPVAMAAMRAIPPMTPPTIGPTGVCMGVIVGGDCVDVDGSVGWVEDVGVFDVVGGDVIIVVGFVNTRPSCPE